MPELDDWGIDEAAQPKPDEVSFDLERVLASVVLLQATVPDDAFTASILGTRRGGNGVLIRGDGLVLTIGYLITEADTVWLTGNDGTVAAAHVVGYDHETGLGLVQALRPLGLPAIDLGSSADLVEGDRVIVAGHGGRRHAIKASVVAKREFAGYWEYVLDECIFTSPPHPNWGGSALIGENGRLLGVGSLLVQQAVEGKPAFDGNMIVPIDILKPILDDLVRFGSSGKPPRPWLGMYTAEAGDKLVVAGLAKGGPADGAGLRAGDLVTEVGGVPVDSLADMFRRIWSLGEAGARIPLTVLRDDREMKVVVDSADRAQFLKSPRLH